MTMLTTLTLAALVPLGITVILTILHYPRNHDIDSATPDPAPTRDFYEAAYSDRDELAAMATADEEYGRSARDHAIQANIPGILEDFVTHYDLVKARALEVGCGSGILQDSVPQYVGMDLSFSARRFFRKPFVQGSATAIPFEDGTFDAAWSIWVLEHVPNPEKALQEIRRVVKDNGYVLLRPAWNVDSWAAQGYEIRPYSDFGLSGKLLKVLIPIRLSRWYALFYSRQVRILRTLFTYMSGRPSQLRYSRLTPNYEKFWVTDSDATVSLDFYEMFLWFKSRGDECMSCPTQRQLLFGSPGKRCEHLIVRVHKP
jgi:SAM-dependent methyltransferase